MSDPPKKLGSLKDRIAAFENKGSVPAPAPAPVPRPKPASAASWKPKPPTPPDSPRASTEHADRKAGMSAADAKESITKGGSLKERMAALQGKGGFGGSPPPVAPKPAVEKPKWKPPPVVQQPVDDDEDDVVASKPLVPSPPIAAEGQEQAEMSNPIEGVDPLSGVIAEENEDEKEVDPAEEERQRRAAIAARMARLGGARVGMAAPPLYGKKPEIKRTEGVKKDEENAKPSQPAVEEEAKLSESEITSPAVSKTHAEGNGITPETTEEGSQDYFGTSGETVSLSLALESAASAGKSTSMPVPAVPRRVAPPRKKAANSPSPASPQPVLDDGITQSPPSTLLSGDDVRPQEPVEAIEEGNTIQLAGNREPEIVGSAQAEAPFAPQEPISEQGGPNPLPRDASPGAYEEQTEQEADEQVISTPTPTFVPAPLEVRPEQVDPAEMELKAEASEEITEAPEAVEDEDEASRRNRIAERLAKSGGFNPFSGPPPGRKPSLPPASPQVEEPKEPLALISPPAPQRRQSQRRESTDSTAHIPPPIRRPSVRKDSNDEPLRTPPPVTAPKPETQARRSSTSSVSSSVSSRRMSQDDHKSILHESMHRHQSSISENITEEPESQAADEIVNAGNAEAAAAHDDYEEQSISVHDDRSDMSHRPSADRGVSYLYVEEKEEEEIEDQQEYEPPRSDRGSTPSVAHGEEGIELKGSITDESAHDAKSDSAPEKEAVSSSRSSRPLSKHSLIPSPRALPTPSGTDVSRKPSVSKRTVAITAIIPSSVELEGDEGLDKSEVASTPGPKSLKSPPPPSTGPLSPPPPVPSIPETVELPSSSAYATYDRPDATPRSPQAPARKDNMTSSGNSEAAYPGPRSLARTRPSIPTSIPSLQDAEPAAPQRSTALPSRRESLPKQVSSPIQRSIVSPLAVTNEPEGHAEREVLEDEDGDPIDPSFHSPARSTVQASSPVALTSSLPPPPVVLPEEGDEEQSKRRTIAERMAKLGGITFGAPSPAPIRPPTIRPEDNAEESEDGGLAGTESEERADPEATPQVENELARKQRIAARIAGMGGMRFGMIPSVMSPPGVASPPAGRITPIKREDDGVGIGRSPPIISKVLSPTTSQGPHTDESGSESAGQQTSDEGISADASESELEEVSHEDAQDETAPAIPSRQTRRTSVPAPGVPQRAPPVPPSFGRPPPVPSGRPPIPSPASRTSVSPVRGRRPTLENEEQRTSSYLTPVQLSVGPSSPNDYVMVDAESIEETPPPPPSRPSRGAPPSRSIPPPMAAIDMSESVAQSSWELPQIPSSSLDFSGETDLSSSSGQWTDVLRSDAPSEMDSSPSELSDQTRRRSSQITSGPYAENMSADDLMAQWGRVGVQIHEIAATMFDKSKKSVVGDGTYAGFVVAAISQVPNASQPAPPYESFGYLIYSQVGSALQRRASDIMPGDVIVLHEAKLKGHKGLQMYHQNVGMEEPVLAIVGDCEAKRSKVKVFQANLHVGQQSVESVSYRLEDVKSGTIKIYRVLEK